MSLELFTGSIVAAPRRSRGITLIDRHYPLEFEMATVERVTAKQAVLKNGKRIWLKDGTVVGDAWTRVFVPTSEQIAAHNAQIAVRKRYRDALSWIDRLNRTTLTIAELEAMKAAYDALQPTSTEAA